MPQRLDGLGGAPAGEESVVEITMCVNVVHTLSHQFGGWRDAVWIKHV
jgi:hypothetical protein